MYVLLWKRNKYARKNQNEYKSDLNQIKRGRNKWKEQKSTLYNIKTSDKAQNTIIKFFDDYSTILYEGRCKGTHGVVLNILTSK